MDISFLMESMLWPAFGLVLYTMGFLVYMTTVRMSSAKSREVKLEYFITKNVHAPKNIVMLNNHFINLFETPVLFYFLAIIYEMKNAQTQTTVIVGWLFLLFRVIHTIFHISGEKKDITFRMISFAITIGMLLYLFFHLAVMLATESMERT